MAKFSITMKNPDWDVNEKKRHELTAVELKTVAMFMEWDEYLTVEFDTTKKTARVCTVKEVTGGF